MSYGLNRGMGIAPASCASSIWCAPKTDCSNALQWAANPGCWGDTATGWAQLASQTVALPAPSVPAAPTDAQIAIVQASADPGAAAAALAQSLSDQAVLDTQANIRDLFDSLPVYGNPDTPPDCSGFFSFLTTGCPGFTIPYWVWIALGVTGGILILKAAR